MQEKWSEWQTILEEMKTMKKREYFLMLAVCVLSGLVLGMLISPKRRVMIGSHNGNNNRNDTVNHLADDCGCECDCDCDCDCNDDACCEK